MPKTPVELYTTTHVEVTASGERYKVTRRKRGLLNDSEVRKIQVARHNGPYRPNGKRALLDLAQFSRARLDELGLPNDKWEVTPVELDQGYVPEEHGYPTDDDLWWDCTAEDTEPLSKDRTAADLLHAINSVMPDCSDEKLSDIWRLMEVYFRHRVLEQMHEAALEGVAVRRRLAKGPATKEKRTADTKNIVWFCAEAFWQQHPKLFGEPVNTANKIFDEVNKKRAQLGVSDKALSPKRIADLLSELLKSSSAAES